MLGVAVLVVAIFALRNPSNPGTAAGTRIETITESPPSSSLSGSSTRSTGRKPSTSPGSGAAVSPGTSPSTAAESDGSSAAIGALPLIVLNNSTTSGLAAGAASRFEAGGWTVTSYGNLQNNILSTCAYYDPAVANARATALRLQQQYPTIERVEPKFAGLPAGPIVVVLTSDYTTG